MEGEYVVINRITFESLDFIMRRTKNKRNSVAQRSAQVEITNDCVVFSKMIRSIIR